MSLDEELDKKVRNFQEIIRKKFPDFDFTNFHSMVHDYALKSRVGAESLALTVQLTATNTKNEDLTQGLIDIFNSDKFRNLVNDMGKALTIRFADGVARYLGYTVWYTQSESIALNLINLLNVKLFTKYNQDNNIFFCSFNCNGIKKILLNSCSSDIFEFESL